jgi:hypothetical protein
MKIRGLVGELHHLAQRPSRMRAGDAPCAARKAMGHKDSGRTAPEGRTVILRMCRGCSRLPVRISIITSLEIAVKQLSKQLIKGEGCILTQFAQAMGGADSPNRA